MTGKMLIIFTGALILGAVSLYGCGDKPPAYSNNLSFSADLVMDFGEATQEYKVNLSGQKVRLDMVKPGTGVTIIRKDLEVIWTLMSDNKLFLEMEVQPQNKNPLVFEPDRTLEYEKLGEETLDGRKVMKECVTIQNGNDKKKEFYRWFDTGLGWPVKIEALDGKWSMQLKDIVPGPQDAALFEIPLDFSAIAARKRFVPKKGPH